MRRNREYDVKVILYIYIYFICLLYLFICLFMFITLAYDEHWLHEIFVDLKHVDMRERTSVDQKYLAVIEHDQLRTGPTLHVSLSRVVRLRP